jgi:Right handed beta helix region
MDAPSRCTFLALIAAALVAGASSAATLTVGPGQSIQAALDAASPGDTILVQPGTYNQNVLIVKDGIKGNVTHYVTGVTVKGFTIQNFNGRDHRGWREGCNVREQRPGRQRRVRSRRVRVDRHADRRDVVHGSAEAGIYVGDSPEANASIVRNETYDNLFGIFQRNALGVLIERNSIHDNCIGLLVLADAPGPSGQSHVFGNEVRDNTTACPPTEEEDFSATSGIGIALLGANDVTIMGTRSRATGPAGRPRLRAASSSWPGSVGRRRRTTS